MTLQNKTSSQGTKQPEHFSGNLGEFYEKVGELSLANQ